MPWLLLACVGGCSTSGAHERTAYAPGPPMGAESASVEAETAEGPPAAMQMAEPAAASVSRAEPAPASVSKAAVRPRRMAMASPAAPGSAPVTRPQKATETPTEGEARQAAKVLIYTANLTLAVFEARKVLDGIEALAASLDGYLLSRESQSITIRVPAASFHAALDGASKLGDVLRRDVHAQDVTDQMFDLEVRLKNARAVRDRLERLLAEARNVNEALTVERELARLGEEIERLQGQLKRLSELVAYSTITVSLQAPAVEPVQQTVDLPFPWLDTLGLPELMRRTR